MLRKVAIIDDDQDDQEIMIEAIKNVDDSLVCECYLNPKTAMKAICSESEAVPDFIFIDMNMPIITGKELLLAIRKMPALDRVVIAIYSTSMPREISERLLQDGANHAFEKPVSFQQYIDRIKSVVVG